MRKYRAKKQNRYLDKHECHVMFCKKIISMKIKQTEIEFDTRQVVYTH